MNRSIVQDNYSLLRNIERESVKIVHNLVCVDGLLCGKTFILVPFGNHAKDISSRNNHLLILLLFAMQFQYPYMCKSIGILANIQFPSYNFR